MGTPSFITDAVYAQLITNGGRSGAGEDIDPSPVVKLLMPGTAGTWLLSEIDPRDPDLAFGLCDLGFGCPELGYVSLQELTSVQTSLGLAIEVDEHFIGSLPLSVYADAARSAGCIVEPASPSVMQA
jgi:hypothetical protein